MTSVLVQGDDSKIGSVTSKAQRETWHQNHVTATGGPPSEEAEPTVEQALALSHRAPSREAYELRIEKQRCL